MVFNEKKIISDGGQTLLKIFHSAVEPGERVYRKHHHTEFEISVFEGGSGIYSVYDKKYFFNEGDVFLFASNEEHCITKIDAFSPMNLLNLHFEPRFVWSSGNDMFDFKFLNIFTNRNEKFENKLDKNHASTKKIRSLIKKIETELDNKDEEAKLFAKAFLLEILATASRDFGYVKKNAKNEVFKSTGIAGIEKSIDYINKNLSQPLSLDELADVAKMSRTYFCTVFKKLNGISPWDYITIKRIEKSIGLIKNENMSMLEVACACGFNNSTNFNRSFKKVTGKTPGEYR